MDNVRIKTANVCPKREGGGWDRWGWGFRKGERGEGGGVGKAIHPIPRPRVSQHPTSDLVDAKRIHRDVKRVRVHFQRVVSARRGGGEGDADLHIPPSRPTDPLKEERGP